MPITDTFRNSDEIIKVSDIIEKATRSFNCLIVTYQSKVLDELLRQKLIVKDKNKAFSNSNGNFPIYRILSNEELLFFLCPIGAASAVGVLEEIVYAFDIKNIVMYGSSGVLNKEITSGKIIVPEKAYRDEGTSYHYAKPSDFITLLGNCTVSNCLNELNIPFVTGNTWTTDGFYRETKEIYQERKSEGCICVEMEVSAVEAFCQFRNISLFSFLYGADSLDFKKWDKRILGNHSISERVKLFNIAVFIAEKLI